MPRLMKYSSNKTLSEPFKDVDDNYLRAIEYGGADYLIGKYHKGNNTTRAIALALVIGIYEFSIKNYYAPKATEVKAISKMDRKKS